MCGLRWDEDRWSWKEMDEGGDGIREVRTYYVLTYEADRRKAGDTGQAV